MKDKSEDDDGKKRMKKDVYIYIEENETRTREEK